MIKFAKYLFAAAALLALPATAFGADISRLDILGFSPDAQVFAYEEYGVQDGSGWPYSNIYFVNTETDSYLPGTPIKVVIDDETDDLRPVSDARSKAASQAAALMAEYRIAETPGILAAFNPISEVGVEEKTLSYRVVQSKPAFGATFTVSLEQAPFPAPANCENLTENYGGFRLFLNSDVEGSDPTVVYEDERVPSSRGCVSDYRLGGIALTGENFGPHMVMVEVHTFGFEGYDGHWIAIPVRPSE